MANALTRRVFLGSSVALVAACGRKRGGKTYAYNGPKVTSVVVNKAAREMILLHGDQVLMRSEVELGGIPVGDKKHEGDMRTPEGLYYIDKRNPESSYFLSLGISYPNEQDIAEAEALGLPPGGHIFIHGTPRGNRRDKDWTAGCIAVSNEEMAQIFSMIDLGTPIMINP